MKHFFKELLICVVAISSSFSFLPALHVETINQNRIKKYRAFYKKQIRNDRLARGALITGGIAALYLLLQSFSSQQPEEPQEISEKITEEILKSKLLEEFRLIRLWRAKNAMVNGFKNQMQTVFSTSAILFLLNLFSESISSEHDGVLGWLKTLWKRDIPFYLAFWSAQLHEDAKQLFTILASVLAFVENEGEEHSEKFLLWCRTHIASHNRISIYTFERIIALLSLKRIFVDTQSFTRKANRYQKHLEKILKGKFLKEDIVSATYLFQEMYDEILRSVQCALMDMKEKA